MCFVEKLEIQLAPEALVKARLEAGVVGAKDRQSVIRGLFRDVGCPVREQPVNKRSGNVICTLSGQTPSIIMVGGHFDFAEYGRGIVDDWSGTSLLPSLFQALASLPRRHTFVFGAFAAEERGLEGSSYFVKNLTAEEKPEFRAFVNLECLGLTPAKVWTNRSDPTLVNYLNAVAITVGSPVQGANVDRVGDDDTHPFLRAGIPVISIHSLTQETLPILHSERDKLSAIHLDEHYAAYRLIAYYLAYLDAKLG